jgi:hypothetical protein
MTTPNPQPVWSFVVPQLIVVPKQDSRFDVRDGKGHQVQTANAPFRALLRTVHESYKGTQQWGEKRAIAKSVYLTVMRQGGRFLDAAGNPKSEAEAMKKIMKSLKDLPVRPTLRPNSLVRRALPDIQRSSPTSANDSHLSAPSANDQQHSALIGDSVDKTRAMPHIAESVALPLVPPPPPSELPGSTVIIAAPSVTTTSVMSPPPPRWPSTLTASSSEGQSGGGVLRHLGSITTISSFDVSVLEQPGQEERGSWQWSSMSSSPGHSIIMNNVAASLAARNSLQSSLFEISRLLSPESDATQSTAAPQISLEQFLGLGDPALWQAHPK